MKFSEFIPTEEVIEKAGKCTTAEEVKKLAREYDVELTAEEISEILKYNSLTELEDEQLDQVAGGHVVDPNNWYYLPKNHGGLIGKYEAEAHIGKEVYAVNDKNEQQYCWGILVRSYETEQDFWGRTERMHVILVKGTKNFDQKLFNMELTIYGDDWTLYHKSNGEPEEEDDDEP